MGMVSSQLKILGNRLENLGTDVTGNANDAEVHIECRSKLHECIKDHQNILE